jgi:acetyltransferase-like isoleucine patch superfamily enzyme
MQMNNYLISDDSSHSNTIIENLTGFEIFNTLSLKDLKNFIDYDFGKLGNNPCFFLAMSHDEYFGIMRERLYKYLKLCNFTFFDIDMRFEPAFKNYSVGGSVYIGRNVRMPVNIDIKPLTTIYDGVVINPGVVIGRNVYIGSDSYIDNSVKVGNSSYIFQKTHVKDSVPIYSRIYKDIEGDYLIAATSVWQFKSIGADGFYISQK